VEKEANKEEELDDKFAAIKGSDSSGTDISNSDKDNKDG
jgi:hypothetical protein